MAVGIVGLYVMCHVSAGTLYLRLNKLYVLRVPWTERKRQSYVNLCVCVRPSVDPSGRRLICL